MKLKAVKQIKDLVNELNKIRDERKRLPLAVDAQKFRAFEWSVDICIPTDGVLYSRECSALFPLLTQLECTFFIGTKRGGCTIFIQ